MANSTITLIAGAAAGVASGPLAAFFNEQLFVYVLMGAAGGSGVALFRWGGWRLVVPSLFRRSAIGALFGGGLASISVSILEAATDIRVSADENLPSVIASCAFVVGFAQERVGQRLLLGKTEGENHDQ